MKKGYTLIELLVGISIFSLVTAATAGFFISALRLQRKILTSREIIDSASYVLEYMGAALRMAKKDDIKIRGINKNCLTGNEVNFESIPGEIKFRNYKNECQRFFLEGRRLKEGRNGLAQEYYLTPDDLEITNLRFEVRGDTSGDQLQARVTILLEIQKEGQLESKISVQTTISQRDLDL